MHPPLSNCSYSIVDNNSEAKCNCPVFVPRFPASDDEANVCDGCMHSISWHVKPEPSHSPPPSQSTSQSPSQSTSSQIDAILCYIRIHIRGSRPDPIQDESRLSRILGPDPHPRPSRRFPCPDNPTLISDSGSAVLQTSVDPVPDPLSGLVTFGVRSPFSTPHCI
jgi:hypothetical protein